MRNIVYVLPETQKSLTHPPNVIGFNALTEWFDFVEGKTGRIDIEYVGVFKLFTFLRLKEYIYVLMAAQVDDKYEICVCRGALDKGQRGYYVNLTQTDLLITRTLHMEVLAREVFGQLCRMCISFFDYDETGGEKQ